jgi:hypothetical protein
MKSYFCSNPDCPSKIQRSMLLLPYSVDKDTGGGGVAPWPAVRELGFALQCDIFNVILPTQPRWHKGSILLTCGGEIGSQRAGDVGVAQGGLQRR